MRSIYYNYTKYIFRFCSDEKMLFLENRKANVKSDGYFNRKQQENDDSMIFMWFIFTFFLYLLFRRINMRSLACWRAKYKLQNTEKK